MDKNALIEQIKAVDSPEAMEAVSAAIRAMPGKMDPEVQQALVDKVAQVTANGRAAQQEIISILKVNGVDYPLTDWLTPANYARKFNLKSPMTVTNWIRRGIIPADHVKEIAELDLRLVRAVEYNPRPYKAAAVSSEPAS